MSHAINNSLKGKKIFVTTPSAGAPGIYAFTRVLRNQGIQIDFWQIGRNKYNFPFDKKVPQIKDKFLNSVLRLIFFVYFLLQYDIFHFYSMSSIIHRKFELKILKIFNKQIINTFVGSDVFDIQRSISEDGTHSPYYYLVNKIPSLQLAKRQKNIEYTIKHSDKVALNGPWLTKSVSKYDAIIPYPRVIPKTDNNSINLHRKFQILHAPTNKNIKGTRFIVEAVNSLQKKGLRCELMLPEALPHYKLQRMIQNADVIIDQILIGWYGGFSVEALAFGKPVIAYLKNEYIAMIDYGKEIPIINADVNTLESTLERLYYHRSELSKLSIRGREFAKKIHSPESIAKQYLKLYIET